MNAKKKSSDEPRPGDADTADEGMLTVFLVSGGTCQTAERVARAALVQFGSPPVKLIRRNHVLTVEQIHDILVEARQGNSLILHTLVSEDLRQVLLLEARQAGVDAMDILGPVLDRLAARLDIVPLEQPGLLAQLAEATSRKIEAVDFAFRHDDGQNADQLGRAEVVLVGISRTMKTPTTLYLAYQGWFAANVPLVEELPLPEVLNELDPQRVICLTMSPDRLRELRLARARATAIPEESYASPEQVQRELRFAERVCAARRWRKVEVTAKSVEEVAREIIALLRQAGMGIGSRD